MSAILKLRCTIFYYAELTSLFFCPVLSCPVARSSAGFLTSCMDLVRAQNPRGPEAIISLYSHCPLPIASHERKTDRLKVWLTGSLGNMP